MAYKILSAAQGCNTSRMVRVVDGSQLVAMFLSTSDAEAYIESKKKERNTKPLTGDAFEKWGAAPFALTDPTHLKPLKWGFASTNDRSNKNELVTLR